MLNQTKEDDEATEVRYVMNYLDCMENLPNDLQRQMSRMLELDSTSQKYAREFDNQQDILQKGIFDRITTKKDTLEKIQKLLIHMQDIGDEKLQIMQTIQDVIETKARELDIDYKNLRPKLEQDNGEAMNVSNSNSVSSNNKNNLSINNDKFSRRGRRAKMDTPVETTSQEADASALTENQSPNLPSTSNGNQKRASTRKKKDTSDQRNQSQDEMPASPENDPNADPDEPTYCICNRISFGKMIMCDNDSCALEWFHFQCVSITSKPKGKWYCPDCRGNKPNIMKTKKRLR